MRTAKPGDKRTVVGVTTTAIPEDKVVEFRTVTGKVIAPPKGAKEVDSGDVDEIIMLDEGDVFTAQYRGWKKVRGKDAENRLHAFLFADGQRRGLYGSMQLNSTLDKIEMGDMVWLAYEGKRPLANGNEMHSYKVFRTASAEEVAGKKLQDLPF